MSRNSGPFKPLRSSSDCLLSSFAARLVVLALVTLNFQVEASSCHKNLLNLLGHSLPSEIFVNPNKGIRELDKTLLPASAKLLKKLQEPNSQFKLSYVVSPDNKVFFVEGELNLTRKDVWTATDDSWTFPIKEAGEVKWPTSDTGNMSSPVLVQKYGVQLSSEEDVLTKNYLEAAIKSDEQKNLLGKSRFKRTVPLARTLKCSELLTKKMNAKKFILTKLGIDTAILTSAILIQRPQRFEALTVALGLQEKEEGRDYDGDLLLADYSTGGVNNIFKSWVGYVATTRGVNALTERFGRLGSSIIMRSGAMVSSVGIQMAMYAAMTDDDAKSLGAYNMGYSIYSIGKSHLVDNFIINKLPDIAYNTCLKNPATRFVLGHGTVRIVDGLVSTVIYLTGRDAYMKMFSDDAEKIEQY